MVKASPSKDFNKHFRCRDINTVTESNIKRKTDSNAPSHVRKLKEKNELRTLYRQLKDVIPSCKSKPVTSLDIVLRAVDYINELHGMLDEQQPEVNANDSSEQRFARQCMQIAANNARSMSFHDITNVVSYRFSFL
uniref:Orphan bHLH-1 transcription factor protein n=1 Tax=Phallusia mammillata TaxID=59560 RepID=A0A6F9D853_9ASCI|nr:Orphan bHLH-1 transcription factor protein [Phallusia mammillata]